MVFTHLLAPAGALYVYMCQFSVCASGNQLLKMSTSVIDETNNKGIGDAGSTADIRMLWSAMVCLGLL